jgi:hypothetical protein
MQAMMPQAMAARSAVQPQASPPPAGSTYRSVYGAGQPAQPMIPPRGSRGLVKGDMANHPSGSPSAAKRGGRVTKIED